MTTVDDLVALLLAYGSVLLGVRILDGTRQSRRTKGATGQPGTP